jgi:hypothetical protein
LSKCARFAERLGIRCDGGVAMFFVFVVSFYVDSKIVSLLDTHNHPIFIKRVVQFNHASTFNPSFGR